MTQESELLYRSILEGVYRYIDNTYGDNRGVLMIKDVSAYTGSCPRTVKARFFKKGGTKITAEAFARQLMKI